jgi:hypothetical protein
VAVSGPDWIVSPPHRLGFPVLCRSIPFSADRAGTSSSELYGSLYLPLIRRSQ